MYSSQPRPEQSIKDQLQERTGLNQRVIRVWFQNKRCKDKKRQMSIREQQEQQEKVE